MAALSVTGLVGGCDLAEGFTDVGTTLANPDAGLLDSPGRKLAGGAYRRLLVDGSLDSGGHVIAIRSDRGQDEVSIIPYLEGSGCTISPGVGVERVSSRIDVELPGMLAVQRESDEAGRGEVVFVDFDCDDVLESLPETALPQLVFPPSSPRGLLALTASGQLYLVDAISRRLTSVAEEVSVARSSSDDLWTIEAGQLVGRDGDLEEFARMGQNVSGFVVAGGSRITAAFLDEDGLSTWSEADGVTLLSETACGAWSWGAEVLAYLDPCDTARLNVHTVGSRLGVDSEFVHIVGPEGVSFPDRVLTFWGQGNRASEFLMTLSDPDSPGEDLIVAHVPEDAEEVDGVFEMETTLLSEDDALIRGGKLYTDWDGVSGQLVEQERDEDNQTVGLVPIASGVAQVLGDNPFTEAGVLTNFDGAVGDLEILTKVGDAIDSLLLAEDVPLQTHTVHLDTKRRAFIADSEDGVRGNLYLTDAESFSSTTPPRARKIAENVFVETARFLDQPRGLAYLALEPGAEYAELRVWLLDSEQTLTVHETVSEYRTVPWPAPGILYAVPAGEDQGLWFSKAR